MILPTLPSALLELALNDLIQVENDPRYRVHMGYWHNPSDTCAVCFGGAVLAKSLGVSPDERIDILDTVPLHNRKQISALDHARGGWWYGFFGDLGYDLDNADLMTDVTAYDEDPEMFKHDIRVAIGILKENDL